MSSLRKAVGAVATLRPRPTNLSRSHTPLYYTTSITLAANLISPTGFIRFYTTFPSRCTAASSTSSTFFSALVPEAPAPNASCSCPAATAARSMPASPRDAAQTRAGQPPRCRERRAPARAAGGHAGLALGRSERLRRHESAADVSSAHSARNNVSSDY